MKNWYVFNVLYELPDDDSVGNKTCSNVDCHLLNRVISYLFSFRESVQDYKIHMDMEIVKFALEI